MSHDSLLDQETRVKAIEDLWKISRRLESPGPVFTDTSADVLCDIKPYGPSVPALGPAFRSAATDQDLPKQLPSVLLLLRCSLKPRLWRHDMRARTW